MFNSNLIKATHVLGIFFILFINNCSIRAESADVIYLIPENFEGGVVIFYDQKDGITPDFNGTEYVFTVPDDGILKVTIDAKAGGGVPRFFFVDKNGNRTEIELLFPFDPSGQHRTSRDISNRERDNSIFVIAFEQGNFNTLNGIVRFRSFLIGKDKNGNYQYTQMQKKITDVQRTFPH